MMNMLWLSLYMLTFKAGNKAALTKSGVYPIDFGMAIAGLIPKREPRPDGHEVDLAAYSDTDPLGSLDDLIKSRKACWWRHLWS